MPRSDITTGYLALAGDTTVFPRVIDYLAGVAVGGTALVSAMLPPTATAGERTRLRRVSPLTLTLNGGFGRVSVAITNADLTETANIAASVTTWIGKTATLYKWITIDEGLITEQFENVALLVGIVTGYRLDETGLEIDLVTRANRASTLSNRRVGSKCPWTFKGTECGYVGVETVCNKLYSDTGGCSGRSNQHRFGGFPDRAGVETIGRISGLGAAPAYQLVQLDTTYTEQRTTLRFDDTFTVTDDPTTNATVITAVGGGGGGDATPDWIDVKEDHDAAGVTTTTTGDLTTGTDQLTVASATGWAAGHGIRIAGAGVGGADLITAISTIAGTTFTLDDDASTTVDDAVVSHDDTAAIQAALNAAKTDNKPVYVPAGTYTVTGLSLTDAPGLTIIGDGPTRSKLLAQGTNQTILELIANTIPVFMIDIQNLWFYGAGANASTATTTGDITSGTRTLTVASAAALAKYDGIVIVGAGPSSANLATTITNISGTTITIADAAGTTVIGGNVCLNNGNGLKLTDKIGNGFFDVTLRNLRFNECGNHSIFSTKSGNAAFTVLLESIDASQPAISNHAIDLWGSNDTTLLRCYVHSVATGKAAYRIRAGAPTLIGCNGIDSGTTASWGIFGNVDSEDKTDSYCNLSLIGCNIESFTDYGVRCKLGSVASYFNTQLIAPATGIVTPIKVDYVDEKAGIFDAQSGLQTLGATYTNGYAVNSNGLPFLQIGNQEFTAYWDTANSAAATFPAIAGSRVGATQDYATTLKGYTKIAGHMSFNEQSAPGAAPSNTGYLYAKDDSGVTGLYWKADGVTERRVDQSLTSTYVGFGSAGDALTGSAGLTWNDTGRSLTVSKAGGNPGITISDTTNTITVQVGTTVGAPDRGYVGTTTDDRFILLQNGGESWGVDTSKHWRPYDGNGTQDIGVAAAKVRTLYLLASVEIGNAATQSGEIKLYNASTAHALTLKAGATSAATTLTLPTDDGTPGQFMKTDGSGVLSWDTPASGANTALSNLASVAINTSLLPGADNTHDLGSASYSWRDAHIERDALLGRQIQSSGSALSASAGTGAGTGPSITIDGNAIAGAIILTTGTSPATSAQIVQMTMAASFTTYPVVIITPANAAAAALTGNKQVFIDDAAMLANKWTLKSGSTALDATTDYVWYFHVMGI